jgi:hypothetical protein
VIRKGQKACTLVTTLQVGGRKVGNTGGEGRGILVTTLQMGVGYR